MKNSVKFSFVLFAALAFAGCGKTEFADVSPGTAGNINTTKTFHSGDLSDADPGGLFTDKDKCKKCHSAPKLMGIDWSAPYMSDGRYNSIEDLINNFDFVNNVHLPVTTRKSYAIPTISEEQKQDLLIYLNGMITEHARQLK